MTYAFRSDSSSASAGIPCNIESMSVLPAIPEAEESSLKKAENAASK
jgi:hypothetical protein